MSTASLRAAARATFLTALAEAGLQGELRERARAHRAEGDRLEAYGAAVKAGRDALSEAQEAAATARVNAGLLEALGAAVVADASVGGAVVEAARGEAAKRTAAERELAELTGRRGLLGRARTKARRVQLERELAGRAGPAELGRRLVSEGRLDEVRSEATAAAVDAVLAVLPDGVGGLGALRVRLQEELALAAAPTALDLRPLLSRTRASEGAAREAAEGAETEAIEAALADRAALTAELVVLADALVAARGAEHESQRVQLEAQLAAVDGEVD